MSCNSSITVDTVSCSVDCANQPCEIAAYGDIGGIGVILGFTITAWLVVALVVAYYVMVYDYSLDTFRGKDDFEKVTDEPNPVDRVFLTTVRKLHPIDYSQATVETKKKINSICNKCVVSFADLQIMTGIAILISGIRPSMCGLQVYHWQIIVHLAWFSSITHLSALSFLRHYLINRRREYYIRAFLMAILAGLLAVAVGLTGHFDWEEPNQTPTTIPSHFARCVFAKNMKTETLAFESMIFDLLLIGYGYTIRLLKTWKTASNWPVKASKDLNGLSCRILRSWRPHDFRQLAQDQYLKRTRLPAALGMLKLYFPTYFLRPLGLAFLRVISLQIHMFTSYLAEVFWLIISCIWRTIRLERLIRQHRPALENDWTFGQILPMLMIAPALILLGVTAASVGCGRRGSGSQSEEEAIPVEVTPATHTPPATPEDQDITDIRDGRLGEGPLGVHRVNGQVPSPGSISVVDPGDSISGDLGESCPPDRRPDDDNARFLQTSVAFKGAVFLIALPYFELGIYLLLGDRKGLSRPVKELTISMVFFNPLLQTLWLTYTTWASRIPLISRIPEGLSALNFTVFVTLVAACLVEFSQTSDSSLQGVAAIVCFYFVLTNWAAFITSGWRLPFIPGDPPPWILRVMVSLALIGAILSLVLSGIFSMGYSTVVPFIFYCLSIFGAEYLEKRRWKYIRAAWVFVVLGVIVTIDIQGWYHEAFNDVVFVYPMFDPLVDFSFSAFGWAVIILFWPLGWKVEWVYRMVRDGYPHLLRLIPYF